MSGIAFNKGVDGRTVLGYLVSMSGLGVQWWPAFRSWEDGYLYHSGVDNPPTVFRSRSAAYHAIKRDRERPRVLSLEILYRTMVLVSAHDKPNAMKG